MILATMAPYGLTSHERVLDNFRPREIRSTMWHCRIARKRNVPFTEAVLATGATVSQSVQHSRLALFCYWYGGMALWRGTFCFHLGEMWPKRLDA